MSDDDLIDVETFMGLLEKDLRDNTVTKLDVENALDHIDALVAEVRRLRESVTRPPVAAAGRMKRMSDTLRSSSWPRSTLAMKWAAAFLRPTVTRRATHTKAGTWMDRLEPGC